jgi:hypothetical protein
MLITIIIFITLVLFGIIIMLGHIKRTKPSANSRYDSIIWCGLCFLISFIGFWLPLLADKFMSSDDNPGGGAIWIVTGPFILAAGIGSIFACRRLIATRHQGGQPASSRFMIALGVIFTLGALSPILIFLFAICFMLIFHK